MGFATKTPIGTITYRSEDSTKFSMEGFGIHLCWHDKDLDKDTGHDEGCAGYGELRRGFSLDE